MPTKRRGSWVARPGKRSKKAWGLRSRYRFGVKGKNKIARICRKTIFRMTESKSKPYNHDKVEIFHNVRKDFVTAVNSPFVMPTQGTGDGNRNGDRIFVSGFKVRLLLGQKYDRPNVTWKIWVLRMGNTIDSLANCWRLVTGNILLDPLNMDQVSKVLYHKTIKPASSTMFRQGTYLGPLEVPESEAMTKEQTFVRSFWLPYKKEYKFKDDGGTGHNDNPIVLFIGAYDAYGTNISDNIGYCQAFTECFYRDP